MHKLHEIKKAGVKTALLTNKDNAFLSFQLFLLQYHPTEFECQSNYFLMRSNWNNARPLFEELRF